MRVCVYTYTYISVYVLKYTLIYICNATCQRYTPVVSHLLCRICSWCDKHECIMSLISNAWHVSFIRVTCFIHMCDMPHSYVWHASYICVTCLIHMCDMSHSYVWHASYICVTCLIHCVTCLIHMHDDFVTCLIRCDTCLIHCVTCLIHCVTCLVSMRDNYVTCLLHLYDMAHISTAWHAYDIYMNTGRGLTSSGQSAIPKTSLVMVEHVYGVATISRLLKIIGLFCKRAL